MREALLIHQAPHLRRIAGFAEQIALSHVARLLAQVADLRGVFDALSDQLKPQTLRHGDYGVGKTYANSRLR